MTSCHPQANIHGGIGATANLSLPTAEGMLRLMPCQQFLGAVLRTTINHEMLQILAGLPQDLPGTHDTMERVRQGVHRLQARCDHRHQRRRPARTGTRGIQQAGSLDGGD